VLWLARPDPVKARRMESTFCPCSTSTFLARSWNSLRQPTSATGETSPGPLSQLSRQLPIRSKRRDWLHPTAFEALGCRGIGGGLRIGVGKEDGVKRGKHRGQKRGAVRAALAQGDGAKTVEKVEVMEPDTPKVETGCV
jgi:hypothetical protein